MEGWKNPVVITEPNGNQVRCFLADPYALKFCGQYYIFCTSYEGIKLLHSYDLIHFNYCGYVLLDPGEMEFWAPCVVYENGIFYMYYSSRRRGDPDVHNQRLKVATACSPKGPFSFRSVLTDTFAIDADVKTRMCKPWKIWYATNDFGLKRSCFVGTSIVEDTLETPYKLTGTPVEVIAPSSDREIFARNRFGDGRDWYTVEGPCYYERKGKQFLMYSGNAYTNHGYFVDYAVKDAVWKKRNSMERPLIHGNTRLMGTGHNSVIAGPNLIEDWTLYHGMLHLPQYDGDETRELCVSRLFMNEGILSVDLEDQHQPKSATIQCGIRGSDYDEQAWMSIGGKWEQRGVELYPSSFGQESFLLTSNSFMQLVMEFSVKFNRKTLGGAGAVLCYIDPDNYCTLEMDSGAHSIWWVQKRNGRISKCSVCATGIDFCEYQTFKIMCDDSIRILVNGECVFTPEDKPTCGMAGVFVKCSDAVFAGITVQELSQ